MESAVTHGNTLGKLCPQRNTALWHGNTKRLIGQVTYSWEETTSGVIAVCFTCWVSRWFRSSSRCCAALLRTYILKQQGVYWLSQGLYTVPYHSKHRRIWRIESHDGVCDTPGSVRIADVVQSLKAGACWVGFLLRQ